MILPFSKAVTAAADLTGSFASSVLHLPVVKSNTSISRTIAPKKAAKLSGS